MSSVLNKDDGWWSNIAVLQNCHTATIKMQSELIIFSQPAEAEPWQPANVHYVCQLPSTSENSCNVSKSAGRIFAMYLRVKNICNISIHLRVQNIGHISASAQYLQCIYKCRIFAMHRICSQNNPEVCCHYLGHSPRPAQPLCWS